MGGMSSTLVREIARQANEQSERIQQIVREVYAEVLGEDWQQKVAEWKIDLLKYDVRAVWEHNPNTRKATGAIVGYIEYCANEDSDNHMKLWYKLPSDIYEQLQRAFSQPGRYIGRIPAKRVVQTREGAVGASESLSNIMHHLSMAEDYLKSEVGVRKASRWAKNARTDLIRLLVEKKKKPPR